MEAEDIADTDVAPLRVIVTDDDPLARRVLRGALQDAGIRVIADARDGREAVELAVYYRPDVVVMDHHMPGMDGIEATRRLFAQDPAIRVVVLVETHDDEVGLRAVRVGAAGFLAKDIELEALPRALRGVARGEGAFSRRFAMRLAEHYCASWHGVGGLRPVRSRLTNREWEVVDLLADGLTTNEIADTLVVSTETVRTHLKHLYRKLDVGTRGDALREASRLRATADADDLATPRAVALG